MERPIRWGMIGCGSVTEQKSGPGLYKAKDSELVAVMSRTRSRAEDWARRHKVARAYDNIDALLSDPEVDAIYVATHPNTHRLYTLLSADCGKPVYCEKPLGMNWEESQQMVSFCKERNVPLFSAYYRRALPKYQMVKALIDGGTYGNARGVHIYMGQAIADEDRTDGGTWRVRTEISGGGKFHDVGSHALDLIDWFFGPITRASGTGMNQSGAYEADDLVHGHFTTAGGVAGTGLWAFNTCRNEDYTTIILEGAKIEYSVLDIAAPITVTTAAGTEVIAVPSPPEHVAQPLIETVVDDLLGRGVCPSTGESGSRTDWVIEQLLKGE